MSEKNPTPVENAKGESAAVPPPEDFDAQFSVDSPAKPLAEPAPADDEPQTTFVVPEGLPFYTTALILPQEDGATLVIDRDGAFVPSADLEALREQAARSGVALMDPTEVSD